MRKKRGSWCRMEGRDAVADHGAVECVEVSRAGPLSKSFRAPPESGIFVLGFFEAGTH